MTLQLPQPRTSHVNTLRVETLSVDTTPQAQPDAAATVDTDVEIPAQPAGPTIESVPRPLPEAGAASLVDIGPFTVSDLDRPAVVNALVAGARSGAAHRPWTSYALHVGGLNERQDEEFVRAMSSADFVYADGMSVVLLAKIAGARRMQRCGTTDIGWDVLRQLSAELGRPVRVALVGGPDGLTVRAAAVLEAAAPVEVVLAEHGYHQDWSPVLDRLAASRCDVVFVGLGAPFEMKWVEQHRDRLPAALVMTCGGWFGFITCDEKRAPAWACRAGLEWVYRLIQAPGRLARRYLVGAVSTGLMAVVLAGQRVHAPGGGAR